MNRPIAIALGLVIAACADSHVGSTDGAVATDAGAPRSCTTYHDCAHGERCGGSDGTGYHCAPACMLDSDCPCGSYCWDASCMVPCTPSDLSTCNAGAVCAGGVCRDPQAWANDCTGHDDCAIGTGCHELITGGHSCETIDHAYCDGRCPLGHPTLVCFDRECRPRR